MKYVGDKTTDLCMGWNLGPTAVPLQFVRVESHPQLSALFHGSSEDSIRKRARIKVKLRTMLNIITISFYCLPYSNPNN